MKMLFCFALLLTGNMVKAQDSWEVWLDKKMLLRTSTEDEQKNLLHLPGTVTRNHQKIVVSFYESDRQEDWERALVLYDEKDRELKRQTGTKIMIPSSQLKVFLQKSDTLKLYTIRLPKDPKKKALVRVRRVHLCTLVDQ